jgi:uncharacterized protein
VNTLPQVGAWRLLGAYEGSEVVRFAQEGSGVDMTGTSVGVEEGIPWSIHYRIRVDKTWRFQHATVTDYAGHQLEIELDDAGAWTVNGEVRPELQGCLDLDFEASVVTNALPVHRLALAVGQQGTSAAAYIRTNGLVVERLDQSYKRLPDAEGKLRFEYHSPRFDYYDTLHFGPDGLAVTYPGIGTRIQLDASLLLD